MINPSKKHDKWKLQRAVDRTVITPDKLIRLHNGDYSHIRGWQPREYSSNQPCPSSQTYVRSSNSSFSISDPKRSSGGRNAFSVPTAQQWRPKELSNDVDNYIDDEYEEKINRLCALTCEIDDKIKEIIELLDKQNQRLQALVKLT